MVFKRNKEGFVLKSKIKLLLMTFIAAMLCSVGVNAESYFFDVNITDSYGAVKDYYYIGEPFSVTADFYSENTEDYSSDVIIALYDANGAFQEARIAQKTLQDECLVATAEFTPSDKEEMYAKCYIWKSNTLSPLAEMSGYYINGKTKSEDVSIYYADVADITASEISAYTNTNTTATTKYALASPCNVVINGQNNANGIDILTSYYCDLQGNPVLGDIVLKDNNNDGLYENVEAKIGFTAIADSVVGNRVYFSDVYSYELGAAIRGDNAECTVFLDGNEIDLADISAGDVLTIYYDMNEYFNSSSFYEVYVGRKKVSGQVTAIAQGEFVCIDNIKYLISPGVDAYVFDPLVGYGYDIFFDAYNKAVYFKEMYVPLQIAVIESVYVSNGDECYAKIIKSNGEKEIYPIKEDKYEDYLNYVYYDSDTYEKRPIQDRVWSYRISESTNNITLMENLNPKAWEDVEYRKEVGKFGTIKISEENTDILDCTLYESENEVYPMQIESLIDGALYTVYAFDKLDDGTYSFVVITAASEGTTSEGTTTDPTSTTEFVVYSKSYITEIDGDNKTAWLVYVNNGTEAVEVIFDDGATPVAGIVEGTPVLIKRNSAGYVTTAAALFDVDVLTDYSAFSTAVRAGMKSDDMSAVLNTAALANLVEEIRNEEHNWVFGVVVDKSAYTITLATAEDVDANGYVNIDYLDEYDMDAECGVMTYSYALKDGSRVSNTVLADVPKLATPSIVFDNDSNDCLLNLGHEIYIEETATYGNTSYALAKTIDGDIVELYAIIPSATR